MGIRVPILIPAGIMSVLGGRNVDTHSLEQEGTNGAATHSGHCVGSAVVGGLLRGEDKRLVSLGGRS